jgi:hypothetical protein
MHFKYFLGGQDPEEAIRLYHRYLGGGWTMPPFW